MGGAVTTGEPANSGITVARQLGGGSIANPYGSSSNYDTGSGRLVSTGVNNTNPYAKPQARMGNIYQLSQPQRNEWFTAQRY